MHNAPDFLTCLAIVFCVAGVTTVIFQKLRQPVVFGYLVAGMIVGPYLPVPLIADADIVHSLSELGVILLMFFLGLEFSLTKLIQVGPTAGLVALVQTSLMVWLGYEAGLLFGWPPLESFYAGAILAVSSTTIIVSAFMEQGIKGKFTEIVFGILIVEDLIGILLMAILTPISDGGNITAWDLAATCGRLLAFLAVLLLVGMLTVPRMVRAIQRLNRPETTLIACVGICFACAILARAFGYSVALGAFISGALVAESGLAKQIEKTAKPLCDTFAAVFFVSVGMLIDPSLVLKHWAPVLVFLVLVVAGKVVGVSVGAFFAGYGTRTSIQAGMSLGQIGEFSFIIASLGLATGATRDFLYPVAVAVSAATTLLTPWMIRWSGPTADHVNRLLPKAVHTFAALYDSWLEQMRLQIEPVQTSRKRRWHFLMLLVDFSLMLGSLAVISKWQEDITNQIAYFTGIPTAWADYALLALVVFISALFSYSIIHETRKFAVSLVDKAMPPAEPGKPDPAASPRSVMILSLQTSVILLIGLPMLAIFQPFLPGVPSAAILLGILFMLAISFMRGTNTLAGHVKAVSEAIVESVSKQSQTSSAQEDDKIIQRVRKLYPGMGHIALLRLTSGCYCAGKPLAQVNVGSLTGAAILIVMRGEGNSFLPTGNDILKPEDLLVIAGTPEAVETAKGLLAHGPEDAIQKENNARRS
ncbi:MAG: cation:proton antiporter [Syntrophorhabdaceae bacterium]|nr:cation:proton antiporter [Syntrophorhabdaceae bacterium]